MTLNKFQLLGDLNIICVRGDDARNFLQNLCTSDLNKTNSSKGSLSGFCSPKGRLQASFWITNPNPDEFYLWISRDIALEFSKKLSMYRLRSKVEINLLDQGLNLYGVLYSEGFENPADALAVCELPTVTYHDTKYDRVLVASTTPLFQDQVLSVQDHWLLLEVMSGVPRITSATKDLFVPQMVNFESVGGVDFKKGCYPGQEIVARSQYLGTIKRRLLIGFVSSVTGVEALLKPGQTICLTSDPDQEVGVIVLAAFSAEKNGYYLQIEVMLNCSDKQLLIRNEQQQSVQITEINQPPYQLLEI